MYLHQKMIRIYADIVQNPTFLGRFQTFGGQCIYKKYLSTIFFIVDVVDNAD